MFENSEEAMQLLTKPVAAGMAAAVMDRYMYGQIMAENAQFGMAVGLGVLGQQLLQIYAPMTTSGHQIVKSLANRAVEVTQTCGIALAADHFIFAKDRQYEIPGRLLTITGADIVGEFVKNTFYPISPPI